MWNYSYVIPSFLVMLVLLTHYFMTPRLNTKLNRSFLSIIVADFLTLLADLVATRADELYRTFSVPPLYLLNLAFFVCYLARAFLFFRFTLDVLRSQGVRLPRRPVLHLGVFLLSEAVVLSSVFTGAVFHIDGVIGYQRGPLYLVVYVCWLYYIALAVYLLDKHSARIDRFSYVGALSYNIVLFIGNFVRIMMPRLLIMSTFCQLALLIIYLAFENPDLYLANRRIAFSMRAFRAEMNDCVGNRPYRVLAFVIQDYVDTRELYGGLQMDRGVDMIAAFLTQTYPEYQVFYLRNGCFAVLGDEHMPWEKMRAYIAKRFQSPWKAADAELHLDAAFVQVGSDAQIDNADKAVDIIVDAMRYASTAKESLIDLDRNHEPDHQADVKRALEQALENDRLEIYLQPLVDGKTRKPVGAEVLTRIRDADGRIIPPSLFVPIAEKNGKVGLMGEKTMEQVCRFLRAHDLGSMGLSWVNINLSPIQCMQRDLSERFLAILSANGVSPESVRLEIDERAVGGSPLLEEHIQTLHESGFLFSLDNYGSGFSSLSRFKRYPFANIKLGMETVLDYYHDQDQMLPDIVQAFKKMGYTVTAEGVESEEVAEAMTAIGCDYLQGFYFSKPLSTDDFVQKYAQNA